MLGLRAAFVWHLQHKFGEAWQQVRGSFPRSHPASFSSSLSLDHATTTTHAMCGG